MAAEKTSETKGPSRDPWHAWVFSTNAQMYMNGEKTYRGAFGFGSFNANRVTEAFKSEIGVNINYNESKVYVDDTDSLGNAIGTTTTFTTIQRDWGVNTEQVKSLDAHWSAVARQRGWKLGIVDATPVRHGLRTIAAAYDRQDAIDEAREFLAGRPYTPADEARRTIATHRAL